MSQQPQQQSWTPSRVALTALFVAILGIAIIGIVSVITGDFGETEQKVLATVSSIAMLAFLAFPSAGAIERGPLWLGRSGLSCTAVLAGLLVLLIWAGGDVATEAYGKSTGIIATLAVGINNVALMSRLKARAALPRNLQLTSYAFTALSVLLITIAILTDITSGDYWRGAAAIFIVLVATTLAAPVANRIVSRDDSFTRAERR